MPRAGVQNLTASLAGASTTGTSSSALLDVSVSGITVSFWVKFLGHGGGNNVVQFTDAANGSGNDSFRMNLESGTNKLFTWQTNASGVGSLGLKTTNSVPMNQWLRLTLTYDGAGNSALYLNGALLASGSGNVCRFTRSFIFFPYSNTRESFSDIRVWQRVLNSAEITNDYAMGTLAPGSVARYLLNEGTGTTFNDSSGNGLNMTGNTAVIWSTDVPSQTRVLVPSTSPRVGVQNFPCSLGFNGSSSKVIASSISGLSSGFSFATWFKTVSNGNSSECFFANATGASDEAGVAITSGHLRAAYNNGSSFFGAKSIPASLIPSNVWTHLVYTFDGTNGVLYVNGISSAIGTFTPALAATNALGIGARQDGAFVFNGSLQQELVYKRAISQAEVTALYTNGIIPASPYAQYNLTEGAGTTAYDTSGNGNNGTITAGTYTADVPSRKRGLVGGNLVYNGDFEFAPPFVAVQTGNAWIDGTAAGTSVNPPMFGWRKFSSSGSNTAQFDGANSHSGANSLKLLNVGGLSSYHWIGNDRNTASSGPTFATLRENGIPILPNTAYTLTFWAKADATFAVGQAGVEYLTLRGDATIELDASSSITPTTSWQQFKVNFTSGANSSFFTLIFKNGAIGITAIAGSVWFDDIILTPATNTVRALAV